MNPLPLFLNLCGRRVVVGSGEVVGGKVSSLARVETMVGMVAPRIGPALGS